MKKLYMILAGTVFLGLAAALVMAQNPAVAPANGPVKRAVFQVENLTCGACLSKINSALGPVEGFSGMGANLLRGMVAVDFVIPLTPEAIGKTITDLGYPATLDGVEELTEKETFAYMRTLKKGGGFGGGCCGSRQAATPSQCPGGGCGLGASAPADKGKDI